MSLATFNRTWKLFQDILRFRSKGYFADCDVWSELKKVKEFRKDKVGYGWRLCSGCKITTGRWAKRSFLGELTEE
jgi:hypothetical protein